MNREAREIVQGQRIEFANPGNPDPVVGIVNGPTFVWFDGIDAVAMIPVYVHATDDCIIVHGTNVLRVGASPVVEAVAPYGA